MGRRGPPKKPTHLALLQGNPGRRPLPKNEPKPAVRPKIPRAPAFLSDEAKRVWPRLAKALHEAQLLTALDEHALELLCVTYGRWRQALEELDTDGLVLMSPNGYPVQSPWVAIANRAFADLRAMLREFGMTPAARTGVQTAGDGESSDPDADRLFG